MAISESIIRADGTTVDVVISEPADGDLQIDGPVDELTLRRAMLMSGDWAVVRQVHSATVVDADPFVTPEADGLVTATLDQPIAAHGADCAPIAFVTDQGAIGVAHVGWRGLVGGVIDATVDRLAALGSTVETAIVGPVIGVECYEFSDADLEAAVTDLSPSVAGKTKTGAPALDMRAGIRTALNRSGVDDIRFSAGCTACEHSGFSHRARKDTKRHALVARIRSNGSAQ